MDLKYGRVTSTSEVLHIAEDFDSCPDMIPTFDLA